MREAMRGHCDRQADRQKTEDKQRTDSSTLESEDAYLIPKPFRR